MGSTIAVVLGGMALGYTAGGRLADRRPGARTLVGLLLLAAGALLAVAFAGPAVLDAVADVLPGPRAGSLTGALLTLAPPAAVLAAASPVALTAVLTAAAAGRDAGRVYAAGAVGSVAGSLGAAFWLVELVGLRALLAGCAAALVVCAAAGTWLLSAHRRGRLLLAAGVPALALASAALHAASGSFGGGVRAHVETGAVSVSVVDDDSELAEAVHGTITDAFGPAEVRKPVPGTGNLVWTAPAGDPLPGCERAQARTLGLATEAIAGARVDVAAGRVLTDDRDAADSLSRD